MPRRSTKKSQVIEAEIIEDETALVIQESAALAQELAPAELSDHLLALVLGTLSPNTRKAYAQDIAAFGKWWVTPNPLVDLVAYKKPGKAREVVLRYQAYMVERDLSRATIARRIRALNSMVKKLNFAGYVSWKLDVPVDKIEALKDVRGPGKAKWKKLLRAVEKDDRWFGMRDLAMIRLMGNDNLRAGEVGLLRYEKDVRKGEGGRLEIFVRGKGQKNVWHPIHPRSRKTLEAWVEARDALLGEQDLQPEDVEWIFFSQRIKQLSGKRVWERVMQRAEEAGIGALHPHALRHHAITQKAKAWNGPQAALTRWARHSDANMTQRYIDEVRDEVYQISQLEED